MRKEFKVKCKNCGKEFKVFEEESKFPIKGDKYFCCRSCANVRHHTKEQKEKIKNTLLNKPENIKRRLEKQQYKEGHAYYCGSKELNDQNPDISCRQSPKYFNKFIPFGLDISTLYTENFIDEYYKVKQLLYNEYVINCLSPKDIYDKYNCKEYFNNSETLLHVFKSMNFPIRNYSQAVQNAWFTGNLKCGFIHNQYKSCWHTTWNNKEVYLRSSYELDYAKELDEQQIDYEVESLRIKYWNT
jgi:hypothetical protein